MADPRKFSPAEFAARIRAIHPGAYDDIPDQELTDRVLKKYPQYQDMVGPAVNPMGNVPVQPGGLTQSQIQAEPGIHIPVLSQLLAAAQGQYSLQGADIPQSTFRKGTALLPYAGGALGGLAGSPLGPAVSIGGAAIGGAGGQALEQLINRSVGIQPPQGAGTPAQQVMGAFGQQGLLEAGGQGLAALARPLAPMLKTSAESTMSQVLSPTTKANKALAKRIVPEMLERNMQAFTRKGLEAQANEGVRAAGEAIDTEIDRMAASGQKFDTSTIVNNLENAKQGFQLRDQAGNVIAADDRATTAIHGVQDILSKYGPDIQVKDLRNVRSWIQKSINETKEGFVLTGDVARINAQKQAYSTIAETLASASPDLAQLNKEFGFWRDLQTVLNASNLRKTGQTGIVEKAARAGIGGMVGGVVGGPGGELAGMAMGQLVQSPAWRTVSAVNKNRFAEFLSRGDLASANTLAARIEEAYRTSPQSQQ